MIIESEKGLLLMRHDGLGERHWRHDDCYKMIFSTAGANRYQTPGGDLTIEQGAFIMVNPEAKHRQLQAVKEKFLIELSSDMLSECASEIGKSFPCYPEFALVTYKHPLVSRWTRFIRDFMRMETARAGRLFTDSSLTQLAILLLETAPGSHQTALKVPEVSTQLTKVAEALQEDWQSPWTLPEMAAISGLSKYQFSRQFKAAFGLSPYSWLQMYRLVKSQNALLSGKQTVLDIALSHGFSNITAYNQLFKKVYGKTPTEFRSIHHLHRL